MSLHETENAPDSAPAADAEPGAMSSTFLRMPLTEIVASLTNPRQTFDQAKLQELAESIKAIGVMQPILVRPLPPTRLEETASHRPRPSYEIVAGERRWRASQLAGVAEIPAYVRQLTDHQVLEAQLVENLQRDDLHALEEAEGYQRLCEATGISKDEIAGKIGKGRTYVYNRLKLLTLGQESRDAFRAGKIDVSRAELLATVGDPKLQVKALKQFSAVGYRDRRMSVRECAGWLEENVLLKIENAPFDTEDATLLARCGACSTCPKRTHADRDLFAAFDGPDMCTDPPCYREKEAAHQDDIRAEAKAKGIDVVILGKEAKKLKPYSYGDGIKGYTRLDAKHADGKGGEATISKLLGKDAPAPVLFVDPHTNKQVKVLPDEVVGQLLKEKGLTKETPNDRDRKAQAERERHERQAKVEAEYERRAVDQVNDRLRSGGVAAFSAAVLRIHLSRLVDDIDGYGSSDQLELLLKMWGLPLVTEGEPWEIYSKHTETVKLHVQAAPDGALGVMLLQHLLADEVSKEEYLRDQQGGLQILAHLADEVGVDLKALHKEVQRELKPPPKREKAADPPGATSQAAPQGSVAAGGAEAPVEPARPPGRRRKLSAAEAKSGIAEAMQGVEEPGGAEGGDPDVTLCAACGVRHPMVGWDCAGDAAPSDIKAGRTVRVLDTVTDPRLQKWVGKEGEVLNKLGDRAFDVSFKQPKGGKVVSFDYTELEVVHG